MSQPPDNAKAPDPFAAWRNLRDANLDAWAKMMGEFVNSEPYSQATAQWLDTYLTVSQPFQKAIETTMTRALTQLNMPLRTDITSLAERLTNIELRLDDLEVKIDQIQRDGAGQRARTTTPDQQSEVRAEATDATGAADALDVVIPGQKQEKK